MDEKIQDAGGKEEEAQQTDPTKGLSKKEQRRVEVLKHELEPRIEQLERQLEALAAHGDERVDVGGADESAEASLRETDRRAAEAEPLAQVLQAVKDTNLESDPDALRLLGDTFASLSARLASLAVGRQQRPAARASHAIQPSGGLPAPDLRAEYERRVAALRPGDLAGLMEAKREFRKRGLEIY